MANKHSQYWLDRAIEVDKQDLEAEMKLLKEIFALYEDSYNRTIEKIQAFYTKYGDEHGLTYQQAIKLLDPIELKECSRRIKRLHDLKESIDTSTPLGRQRASQIQREIQLLRNRGRITRELALLDSINEEWINTAYKIDEKLGDLVSKTYSREYIHALEQAGVEKIYLPVKALESAILIPTFGDHFSDRVWKNKDKIVSFVKTEIRRGLVEGTNVRKTTTKLMKQLDVTRYEARRLVVTENAIARVNGSLEGYRASDIVEWLVVIEVMDARTCPQCKDIDGDTVKLSNAIIGDNIPPFHPLCRGTIAPYFED
jgi:SPP1 gp7 family putative phage head morphogenesis protein